MRGLRNVAAIVLLVASLIGCGGGRQQDATPGGVKQALAAANVTSGSSISVSSVKLVSSTRIDRTVWQYVYGVAVRNDGPPIFNASIRLAGVGPGTTIVNGSTTTGFLQSGETQPALNNIIVRQDRSIALDTASWSWQVVSSAGQTTAKVDPSLGSLLNAQGLTVRSNAGSAVLGAPLPVASSISTGEAVILLVDRDDSLYLAGLANSQSTTLSARGTIIALARMSLAYLPQPPTTAKLTQLVDAAPELPHLISIIEESISKQTSPIANDLFAQRFAGLIRQILIATSEASGARRTDGRKQALGITEKQLAAPYPITVLSDGVLTRLPVQIVDSGYGSLRMINPMPIPWSVASVDVARSEEPSLLLDNKVTMTGLQSGWSTIATTTAGPDSLLAQGFLTKYDIPAERSINFSIGLTPDDRLEIGLGILLSVYKTALGLASIDECAGSGAKELLKASVASYAKTLGPGYSFDEFRSGLVSEVLTLENVAKLSAKCVAEFTPTTTEQLASFKATLKGVSKVFSAWSKVKAGVEGIFLTAQVSYAYYYWSKPATTFTVCLDVSGRAYGCTTSLAFSHTDFFVSVGVDINSYSELTVRSGTSSIGIPSTILYTTDAPSLISLDRQTGAARAIAAGSLPVPLAATIKAQDVAGNVEAEYLVTIVPSASIRMIADKSENLVAGDYVSVSFVDPLGHQVILPSDLKWELSDQAMMFPDVSSLGVNRLRALKAGQVTLSAVSVSAGFSGKLTFNIAAPDFCAAGVVAAPQNIYPRVGERVSVELRSRTGERLKFPAGLQWVAESASGARHLGYSDDFQSAIFLATRSERFAILVSMKLDGVIGCESNPSFELRVDGDQWFWTQAGADPAIESRPDRWLREGYAFSVARTNLTLDGTVDPEAVPLYRHVHSVTYAHFWTTRIWESQPPEFYGFQLEGSIGFVYKSPRPGTIPWYRYFNPVTYSFFYYPSAIPPVELDPNFAPIGPVFYALASASDPRAVPIIRYRCTTCWQ